MSKVIAAIRPVNSRVWRLFIVAAIVLSALVPGAMVARADDDKDKDDREFTIVANVVLVNQGFPSQLRSGRFSTTGEMLAGCIASSGWQALTADSANCNPFVTQSLMVNHSSVTTVSPSVITGNASGGFFSTGGVVGEYEGHISALYDPSYGFDLVTGFPNGIYQIRDWGRWEAEDGTGKEVNGTFTLTMSAVWTPYGPTLAGQAVLVGKRDR